MIAPLLAAGIASGVGSVVSGITGGKGAKAAAQAQQKTAQMQIQALQDNRNYIAGLSAPTIDRGNAAGSLIGSFLGTEGGDRAASALATFRNSTGYKNLLDTGLGAVNSNAYARGMGNSGATLKALQTRGSAIADQSAGSWLNGLNSLYQTGNAAIGNVAGVATQTTNGINAANQNAADAASNASLAQSAGWQNAIQGLANAGASYASGLGSSYGGNPNTYGANRNPYGVFGGGIY